jgi:hypothetical protein
MAQSRVVMADIEKPQTKFVILSYHDTVDHAHKARKWWKDHKDNLTVGYQPNPLVPPWAKDPKWFDK